MKSAPRERAIVLLSGGQDSTTCLYWALRRYGPASVIALSFDYGQRHRIELDCAARLADQAGVEHVVLPINSFTAIGGDELTETAGEVSGADDDDSGLPATFVAGRNLVFLTLAAALAYRRNVGTLVTGVAQTDYSGYPDCREQTILSLRETLKLGMEFDIAIETPLMHLSKAETVRLAVELGALDALADSHTCYNGERPPCGRCAACDLRAKGFAEAGIADPLLAATA